MLATWFLRWNTPEFNKPEIRLSQIKKPGTSAHPHGLSFSTYKECLVAFDGYLFENNSLLSNPEVSCAEFIADAYTKSREGFFERLRGGFALAIWDGLNNRLIAGRDAFGLHPLYYWWDGRLFLLSPDIDQILAQPEVSGKVNQMVLAEYLQNTWHAHQRFETFYEDILRLPAAHQLCLSNHHLQIRRYWDPLPPNFHWARDDELIALPVVLERAVCRCLEVGADCLALSGGFDSVSLAVMASTQQCNQRQIYAVSLNFDIGSAGEEEVQIAVARNLGIPQMMQRVSDNLKEKNIVAASLNLSKDSPLPVFGLWQSMYSELLESASNLGLHQIMMGIGGDEIFMVDPSYCADCLEALDLAGLWRFYRTFAGASPSSRLRVAWNIFWSYSAKIILLDRLRSALLALSPPLTEALRSRNLAFETWLVPGDQTIKEAMIYRRLNSPEVDRNPGESRYVRTIRGLAQSTRLMTLFEQGYSWAARAGFRMLYPYFDRDLVELTLRMHPESLMVGGYTKSPLRRLIAKRLPEVTLPPRKVAFNQPFDVILREQGLPIWRKLGGPARLADLGLVEPKSLTRIIEDYFSGWNDQRSVVWTILSAETWLRARTNSYIL